MLSPVRLQAVLIGERITGRGVVQAVDHAVGVPLWEIEPLLGALVLALLVGAVYPRRRFALQKAEVCPAPLHCCNWETLKDTWGSRTLGARSLHTAADRSKADAVKSFSRQRTVQDEAWTTDEILAEAQVWVRRLACICFAVMIVAEVITGKVRVVVC